MSRYCAGLWVGWVLAVLAVTACDAKRCGAQSADPAAVSESSALSIPQDRLIQPEALNKMLASGDHPIVFQVGSHVMFTQAHIPGAHYAGPGGQPAGLQLLESKVGGLPKTVPIVIYCGCCPWNRCPNAGPAFHRLEALGFTNVKVLYIGNNFGADWVQRGYSVETGG